MTGNQVEQLESRVRELEATLTGLTDELVDTKDRLQAVERAAAGEEATGRRADIVEGELLGEDEAGGTDTEADTDTDETENDSATGTQAVERTDTEADTADDNDDADDADEETDSIIVA